MGDFYFGNKVPTSIYFGSSSVSKIYYGSYLIWGGTPSLSYRVEWAIGAPVNCDTTPNLPLVVSGGDTTLYIEPSSYFDLDHPKYNKFQRVYVGTEDGGNDIINYTYSNFIFDKTNYPEPFNLSITIPSSAITYAGQRVYCDFRFEETNLTAIDITGTAASTTTVTVTFTFSDLGVQSTEFLVGRRVFISGYFGKGATRKEAIFNLATNKSTMSQIFYGDAMITSGSTTSAVTIINAATNAQFQDGSVLRTLRVQVVRGSAVLGGSTFRFAFVPNNAASTGTYWFFPVQILVE